MNGIFNDVSPGQAIIRNLDGSSVLITNDALNVIPEISAVYDANNQIYNRRRLRFVKLQLVPAYTNSQMQGLVGDGSATVALAPAPRVFIIAERDGIDAVDQTTGVDIDTIPQMMANPQAKMVRYPRTIKMMMRGAKYPYAPKYATALSDDDAQYGQYNKAGAWVNARSATPTSSVPHLALVATGLPSYLVGQTMYYVKHTFYFEWADRVYNNTQ